MPTWRRLGPGDPLPTLVQESPANPRFVVDTLGGRWLVLAVLGSTAAPGAAALAEAILARGDRFDDAFATALAVTCDPSDRAKARLANRPPGFRVLWDLDLSVARALGAAPLAPDSGPILPRIVVADPTLRCGAVIPLAADGSHVGQLMALLDALPPPHLHAGRPLQAPVLFLPRVFEPELCTRLIAAYEAAGGAPSGFMREVGGRTVGLHDPRHKVRRDHLLADPALIETVQRAIARRVVPEIAKVHQFHATRMERYLVGCYDAAEGGHFAAHRDNTTTGTAHRRFAVSVNLNDDFEGGAVSFPEYGPEGFRAPAGGAVVFSCSLLHAVSPVTAGRRYAFLPFLYDEAAAEVRDRNRHLVAGAEPGAGAAGSG